VTPPIVAPPPPRAPERTKLPPRKPTVRKSSIFAHGEPLRWLTGGALVVCAAMIVGLLLLVAVQGLTTFWPAPYFEIATKDGVFAGEVTNEESYTDAGRPAHRRLLRVGNFELTGVHYRWFTDGEIVSESRPEWGVVVERLAWGRFYGKPVGFMLEGQRVASTPEESWALYEKHHGAVRSQWSERRDLETSAIGKVNAEIEDARLELRKVELASGLDSAAWREAKAHLDERMKPLDAQSAEIRARIDAINAKNEGFKIVFATSSGKEVPMGLADIVRAYPANRLGFWDRCGVYFSRWGEFLSSEPREANSEGGVFPAIFGTVVMSLIMSLLVVPLGVLAALYLREYAKAGPIVSAVRIAVNNLAGVPSIVFGVFGLGFFCYTIGASLDQVLFEERLPSPTFGTGGIMWASLTLALLTLPVVIVATEEALAAVPGSMREGSYACGASKWQTIRRIVLPRAMPGIMTGLILAMARGAGEVAPLMLVGALKLAPALPIDGMFPYVHLQRSFMHLGYHICDLGQQSQNSEAAKPMVYTTTILLILLIVILNLTAVHVRTKLRRKFVGGHF
jgi:phosphate transport system permease protein